MISGETSHFIQQEEGLRLKAYPDGGWIKDKVTGKLVPVGVWTIGYGTTTIDGKPVQPGMACTKEQATKWMLNDATWRQDVIKKWAAVPLNDPMLTALVSLAYNIGMTALKKFYTFKVVKN